MGKSLFIQRMAEELKTELKTLNKTEAANCQMIIPIHGPIVTADVVLTFLKKYYKNDKCMIYHFDIAPNVRASTYTLMSINKMKCCALGSFRG